jgi:hypothetical protein
VATECSDKNHWRDMFMSLHGPADHGMRLVLCSLLFRMYGETNSGFPGQPLIADETYMGIRTISRHLVNAEAQGWIKMERKRAGVGRWRVNIYTAAVPDHLAHLVGLSRPDHAGGYEQEDSVATGKRSPRKPKATRPAKLASRATADDTVTLPDDRPNSTERPAKFDTTTSQIGRDDQPNWRTNPITESVSESVTDTHTAKSRCAHSDPTEAPSEKPETTAESLPTQSTTPLAPSNGVPQEWVTLRVSTLTAKARTEDPLEVRLEKAAKLLRCDPDFPDANIAKMFKLTDEQVSQARAA